MTEIIPAIMEKTLNELRDKLALVRGLAPYVQIDVMDGIFVPNISFPYVSRGELKIESDELPYWQDFSYEFDLMVKNPDRIIGAFLALGASRIVLHTESIKDEVIPRVIEEIKNFKAEVGLASNNDTPLSSIEAHISEVDFVQVMGIARIGFQGEPFDERALERIRRLRAKYPDLIISVDGSVNLKTAPRLVLAGANRLVAGSAVFESGDARGVIEALKGDILENNEKENTKK